MILDIKTLVIVYFVIASINIGTMAIIRHQYRKQFAGISSWLVSMSLQPAGLALIFLRGRVTDFVSVELANVLLLGSAVCFLNGLERFVGLKERHVYNIVLLAFAIVFITHYSTVAPDMTMRKIIWSAMVAIYYAQSCWLLLRRVAPDLRQVTRITGIILGCYVAVSLTRIILLLIFPLQTRDFFKPGIVDSLIIPLYIMLGVCLTISLILMLNRRLFGEIQAQKEKFTTAFHSSPYAIILTRISDGRIIEVNDGFVNITGYRYDEVIGRTLPDLCLWHREEDRGAVFCELSKGNEVHGAEYQFRKKGGEILNGLFSANIINIHNERCILSNISDITELSQMKQRLQVLATHDALTGLPNRRLLSERFEIALANAQGGAKKLVVMSLDFDHFKMINDDLGHDTGDRVLVAVAARLRGFLREVDTVARFGGDEFVLLLREIDHPDGAVKVVRDILLGLREPFLIGARKFILKASIGVAIYPDDGRDLNELIKRSDEALYFVKKNGRDNYLFYANLLNKR